MPDRKVVDADIRIYRGGSFADLPLNLRSAYRDAARPTNRFPAIGFRVVRTYVPERAEAIQAGSVCLVLHRIERMSVFRARDSLCATDTSHAAHRHVHIWSSASAIHL